MKRHRSPNAAGEGSGPAKQSKTSPESTATRAETDQLSENLQNLDISVSLRSATKAARNDPKPPLPVESIDDEIAQIVRDSSSLQAIGGTENPRGPDQARASSPAAGPGLVDGQHSATHGSPLGPAPTANSRQLPREGNFDKNKENDDSDLDDDHSDEDDDDEDDDDENDYDEDDDDENDYDEDDDGEDEDGEDEDGEDLYGLWDEDAGGSDDEFPWYEELDGLATLKPSTDMPTIPPQDKQQIAGCNAMLIRRGGMRESFWTNMEEPTQETSDLAFDLFDRYGRLNPEFYEHDINKGTGVWGKELDHGDILLFDVLRVDAAYRRRGIGAKLVNAILEKTREMVSERVGFFALTRSGFLWSEMSHLKKDSAEMEKAQDDAENGALGFWHAMGFRRVGTSSWLAWTDSPGHPSRQLAISQDWRSPDDLTADIPLPDEMKQAFQKLADPAVKAAECVDELTKTLPKDFEAGQWQTIDQDGNTLLHIASLSCKPEVTSFLLSKAPRLTTVRNKRGHTALEALQNQLEGLRTRRSVRLATLVTSDAFKGFSDSSIACLAALKHTAIFDLSSLSSLDLAAVASATDEQIARTPHLRTADIKQTLRYKYGCTCGQCIGGFLSPRMKFALLCVAEIQHGNMELSIDETGPGWVSFHDDLLTHLPRSVRENLNTNRSMRKGFANMFSHFAQCLHLGRIPTEAEVLDFYQFDAGEWPPVTRNYLQRGGSVAAVANAIFERAMEQDEWAGDGAHRGIFWEDIDALVACRNDHEFGFVAGVCGYKRVRPSSSRFVDLSGRELDLD